MIFNTFLHLNRPGQQPQLVQTIQQNPQIVQIQSQQNQQNQPVQIQQVNVQQSQAQPQQRKGLTLSVNEIYINICDANIFMKFEEIC